MRGGGTATEVRWISCSSGRWRCERARTSKPVARAGLRATADPETLVTVMDHVTPGLMARQWPVDLAYWPSFVQLKVLHVREDRVVCHERNLQPDCRRGHPTIRLMLLLAQAVPGSDTPGTKRG